MPEPDASDGRRWGTRAVMTTAAIAEVPQVPEPGPEIPADPTPPGPELPSDPEPTPDTEPVGPDVPPSPAGPGVPPPPQDPEPPRPDAPNVFPAA